MCDILACGSFCFCSVNDTVHVFDVVKVRCAVNEISYRADCMSFVMKPH